MSRARRIDTHQHVIPPHYAEWMQDKGILGDAEFAPLLDFLHRRQAACSPTPAVSCRTSRTDPDHITYGSDFPFAPAPAIGFITKQYEEHRMHSSLRAAIDRGNSEALFPRLKL